MKKYHIKSGDDDGVEFTCEAYQYRPHPDDEMVLSVGNIEVRSVTVLGVEVKATQLHNAQIIDLEGYIKDMIENDDDLRDALFANATYSQRI